MKTKAIVTILMLLISCLLTVGLNATLVRAEEDQIGAMVGRYCMYSTTVFEDAIANIPLVGSRLSRFDITPVEENVDVFGARIEMLTTYPITAFPYINWAPYSEDPAIFEYLESPAFTYKWDWSTHEPISESAVWLGTNFLVTFEPGSDCERVWNPWITSPSVTQTLTIVFTPSTAFVVDGVEYHDFHGVHVSVQIPSTDEASPTIDEESISATPPTPEQPDWSWDYNYGDGYIEVNWRGNPVAGTTYYFSVDVTVINNLAPKPIFYKPSVGIGANFNPSETSAEYPVQFNVDLDGVGGAESLVTYSGTGDFSWLKLGQNENALSLPGISMQFPFVVDGKAFIKLEDGFVKGSGFLLSHGPTHVSLVIDGQAFWWEIIEMSEYGRVIIVNCEPAFASDIPASDSPGPVSIKVRIPELEEGGQVVASGPGVAFSGKIISLVA